LWCASMDCPLPRRVQLELVAGRALRKQRSAASGAQAAKACKVASSRRATTQRRPGELELPGASGWSAHGRTVRTARQMRRSVGSGPGLDAGFASNRSFTLSILSAMRSPSPVLVARSSAPLSRPRRRVPKNDRSSYSGLA